MFPSFIDLRLGSEPCSPFNRKVKVYVDKRAYAYLQLLRQCARIALVDDRCVGLWSVGHDRAVVDVYRSS